MSDRQSTALAPLVRSCIISEGSFSLRLYIASSVALDVFAYIVSLRTTDASGNSILLHADDMTSLSYLFLKIGDVIMANFPTIPLCMVNINC